MDAWWDKHTIPCRGRYFGVMSQQAILYERWGQEMYDYSQPLELENMVTGLGDAPPTFWGDEDWHVDLDNPPVFIRLSQYVGYGKDNQVLWEGFRYPDKHTREETFFIPISTI